MTEVTRPNALDLHAEARLRAAIEAGEIGPDAQLWRFFTRHRIEALTMADTARAEAEAKDALLRECQDKLGDIVMGEGLHPDEAVTLHAKITAALSKGPTQ